MTIFEIHGPFIIEKKDNGLPDISKNGKRIFWENVNRSREGLEKACGCYLFASQAGKGITPWYVGITEKQTFKNEIFQPHKIQIYQDAIANKKCSPIIFLISKLTKKKRFAKPRKNGDRSISFLENLLIGVALDKNKKLFNLKKTKKLRYIQVPGLLNSPKRKYTIQEKEFKRAIFK